MKDSPIIVAEKVSKVFKIPHEKQTSLKGTVVNLLRKKKYTKYQALNDIDLSINEGEFFGIIGKNGCGKSTLLKILAGIYVPTSGKVKINGRVSPFLELGVGFNPELTARENVYLNGSILGLSKKEIDEKFDEIIEFAELKDFVDMKLSNFSSGMQVRLAFSVAIQAHSDILLIDEVLAVGDANFQKKCFDVFRKIKKQGKTVVFVSHGMDNVREFCDRAVLIHDSRIVSLGVPDKVIYDYENRLSDAQIIESAKNTDSNFGTRKLEIEKVDLISGGKPAKTLNYGEDLLIRIHFNKKEDVKSINASVAIRTEKESFLCMRPSTLSKNFKIKSIGKRSVIDLKIDKIPLHNGRYYLNVSLFGEKESDIYNIIYKASYFSVKNKGMEKDRGIVFTDYSWNQNVGGEECVR